MGYVEKQPGKFVGDTACEKLPIEICGAGCTYEEGPEECHDKVITSLLDVPQEICSLRFTQPRQVPKPLQTRWCLDPTPPTPGNSYEESESLADPISTYQQN